MHAYKAPLRDMRFVVHEVLELSAHYRTLGRDDVTVDLMDSVMEEGARFAEEVLAPTNPTGDLAGVRFQEGVVTTPPGFREAYAKFCGDGWSSMTAPTVYGGQGLPDSAQLPFAEMLCSANLAWRVYSGLAESAILAIDSHASEALKALYLPQLSTGNWAGTMCLTEPHCGTDLGLLKTRAEPQPDGSFRLSGTKIFITGGEQDLTENIVHLVLARLPDAPAGSRGISLFLVPKFLPDAAGRPGTRNAVRCGSVEHKMGIKASATCVMHFTDATGWLVGPPHTGLACMFTMMNHARLGVGIQGLGLSEMSFQGALAYARDRLQGRSAGGPKQLDKAADPLIVHADVRRMLLTQKALTEGGRMLACFAGQQLDIAHTHPDAGERKAANDLLALLTPIVKAFLTDAALEVTNLGVQIFGGHGYIHEHGMEQLVRDARIGTLYEGTNGIQALDLIGRKVLGTRGELVRRMASLIVDFCGAHSENAELKPYIAPLAAMVREWGELTQFVAAQANRNADEAGAAAVDYLQFSGYLCLAWCWARMAATAQDRLSGSTHEADFYRAKLATATFFFERLLPRARAHAEALRSGAGNVMSLDAAHFAF
jgi:alkylation response protein AidB-like acyl-CoA dehydrogenase